MFWRFSSFVLFQLAGGLAGWWLGHDQGALIGVAVSGLVWFAMDLWRGLRILQWLRRGDATGAPAMNGLWGEIADRTRRALRAREQQTQESQLRLQEFLAAIQASPNGVVLLDAQGRIEWCNQTAADQLGIDAQRDMLQLIGNLVRDPVFAAYYAGNDFTHDAVMQGRDSTAARPVKISVHLHPYGEGRKLLLSRDITALEQAETMRRDFVANVSHEIRTPLTVLTGFVETLQTLPLDPQDRARYLGLMAQQSSRMQTLVNDLLTLSRLEGSPLPGMSEWTPVHVLMTQCEQEGRALSGVLMPAGAKPHRLHFGAAPDSDITGSQTELLSAMSNLVSNAIRYTPPGGSIEVKWQSLPDGRAEFSVKDSGPGIAPEHLSRLTERFYRVDRSRSRETGGTGLGLAIVKHVVQRHGAELRIESTPGAGSTFCIQFPASRLRPAAALRGLSSSGAAASRPATESLQK
ncbi:phosphate regulon sensor histidine kinase PhoR [Variovorax terrae]|uniref:Phosphate regulon sensor protein PhoR n=1 Tax=Variovorax terrae TaxID=2923278 RepID=A0A9X2ALT9_9BURK|nr:phosphate regulon sensor histidine kinase PhoR [Variovorax terrae]MCJ0763053.1 phosphate regulon sensor histidine kinase PhoR [Variovorax terrae]